MKSSCRWFTPVCRLCRAKKTKTPMAVQSEPMTQLQIGAAVQSEVRVTAEGTVFTAKRSRHTTGAGVLFHGQQCRGEK